MSGYPPRRFDYLLRDSKMLGVMFRGQEADDAKVLATLDPSLLPEQLIYATSALLAMLDPPLLAGNGCARMTRTLQVDNTLRLHSIRAYTRAYSRRWIQRIVWYYQLCCRLLSFPFVHTYRMCADYTRRHSSSHATSYN